MNSYAGFGNTTLYLDLRAIDAVEVVKGYPGTVHLRSGRSILMPEATIEKLTKDLQAP